MFILLHLCVGTDASASDDGPPALADASDDNLDYIAYTALQANSPDRAAAAFMEVLRRDSADAFAHAWLGGIAARSGDLERAEAEFAHAVTKVHARMEASDAAEAYARRAKTAELERQLHLVREV